MQFGYTDNQGILLGNRESQVSPWALPSRGVWFSSWYVVSIDTGHRAQSPQSGPRWSLAFKMEPALSVSSFTYSLPRPQLLPLSTTNLMSFQEFLFFQIPHLRSRTVCLSLIYFTQHKSFSTFSMTLLFALI